MARFAGRSIILSFVCYKKCGRAKSRIKNDAEEPETFCPGKTLTLSIPSYYWFVDEFPLLTNGKIIKPELKKIAEATGNKKESKEKENRR